MHVDGRCHCGAITFEAEVDPDAASLCHCTDCQQMTGSAFRANIRADAAGFKLKTGTPARYLKTTAESGNKRVHAFCPSCGTPIFATSPGDNPPAYTLRIGTLTQRHQLTPKVQNWVRSAQPWVTALGTLPSNQKG